ncbi:hypothetical protein [Gimesia aquarii]|uniref:ABC-2 family transporter protein n=1 Tax=Gimesia aquarii TaxID=2527964 RepID=A0A517W0G1_9PLAN|nr:hypothetical protein [Gimesia aquarii]QDT98739.1 ABC-2 family transporter protein [Gimesia aquarii]
MDSVLQSLLWKEWHERKRTFFVCLAWILSGLIYVVIYESVLGYRTPVSRFSIVCIVYSLFMTVFLAMRVCLSEVTHQSLSFSSTLPVSLHRIAAVRLLFAIFTLVGPVLLGAFILAVLLICGVLQQVPPSAVSLGSGRSIVNIPGVVGTLRPSLAAIPAVGLLGKVICIVVIQIIASFMAMVVIGVRCRRESHVGFLGAIIAFLWIPLTAVRVMIQSAGFTQIGNWIGIFVPHSLALFSSYGDTRGIYHDIDIANWVWIPLILNLVILFWLGFWFTRRYGTRKTFVSYGKKRWWNLPPLFSWISFPHRGQTSSLIWINLRQSVPLVVTGFVLACLVALMTVFSESTPEKVMEMTAYSLPSTMWVLGILWATVVGSGVFAAELAPDLGHFWISRPISINRWFWFKYFVGLFTVLLVLDGTTILVSWNSLQNISSQTTFYNTNFLSWSYIVCYPVLHSMMYSLAVLGVCWWKKPVRGAVVALSFFFIGSMVMESIPTISDYDPIFVYNNLFTAERGGKFNLANKHFPLVYGMVSVITLFTAYLASKKIQRLEE